MKKITKATLKSFIKKNFDQLQIKVKSAFDGQTDGMEDIKENFKPIQKTDRQLDYTLGIDRVWIVGYGSSNYFNIYEDNQFSGIEVSNCCRNFILAIRK